MKPAKPNLAIAIIAVCALAGSAWANNLYLGETAVGQMGGPGATQDLFVDLAAGDDVQLKLVTRAGAKLVPAVTVADPAGATVAESAAHRKVRLSFEAAATGTHRIRLTAVEGAGGFALTLKGPKMREYVATGGEIDFDAVAGSILDVRVKAKDADPTASDPKGAKGQVVMLLVRKEGSNKFLARSGALAVTDQYKMAFAPEDAEARVQVKYPSPRGKILLPAAAAPAGNQPPAGNGDPSTNPAPAPVPPPAPPGPTPAPAPPPTPMPPAEEPAAPQHDFLAAALLEGERDEDVDRALAALEGADMEPLDAILMFLAAELDDEIIEAVRQTLEAAGVGDRPARAIGIERIGLLVDADRRHRRAVVRQNLIEAEFDGCPLAGNPVWEDAMDNAAGRIAAYGQAIEETLGDLLSGFLWNDNDPRAAALEPPVATADDAGLLGIEEFDAALLAVELDDRARAGDMEAVDVLIAFYRTWVDMLVRNGDLDVEQTARLGEISDALAELEAIAAGGPIEDDDAGEEKIRLLLAAVGVGDPEGGDYLVEAPLGADERLTPEGLEFDVVAGPATEVRWMAVDGSGGLAIRIEDGRVEIIARAEEVADQMMVAWEVLNPARLEVEETPEGLRMTGEMADGESIAVRWNIEGREGGFDLRVVAGQ